jgi:hypothetical protein
MQTGLIATLVGLLAPLPLVAEEARQTIDWGLQCGLAFPASSDLKLTTRPGVGGLLGVHFAWQATQAQALRARVDAVWFSSGSQDKPGPILEQQILTQDRNGGVALEYLYRPSAPMFEGRWALGAGLHLIRWTVAGKDRLSLSNGSYLSSGTSAWTREGIGGVVAYRLRRHLEFEGGILFSHYGYENQAASYAYLNLLWHH